MSFITKIGSFNADTRTVPVTFTQGDVIHSRPVNAVLKEDGSYDRAATKARVAEVANGVAAKIGLGVITARSDDEEQPIVAETTAAPVPSAP